MLEEDIDDTHLCIKCSSTIVGLDNYVQHRKNNCSGKSTRDIVHVDHPYGAFDFTETTSYPIKNEEVEKGSKSLTDTYDLPYDLGADVFFSSLELQSSSKRTIATTSSISTSGKQSSNKVMTRKATAALLSTQEHEDEWIESGNNSDNLMKAVRDISGNKKFDSTFKLITFQHDSPEPSEVEDDDDEDYEAVPANHTGGKWKPDNLPGMRQILLRNSPAWSERHQWDISDHGDEKAVKIEDQDDFDHDLNPPPGHTKGKWIPGTKIIKLDYKEDVEIEKIYTHQYWCNTCNRKLASKLLYERHLKSNLHLKRAEPEQELEQATVKMVKFSERIKKPSVYLNQEIYTQEIKEEKPTIPNVTSGKKRRRRKYFTKCETCKTRLPKYLMGKHLISHYHYRRMILNPTKSFDIILENIHKIVLQAPYQCQPCRFYTNTEEDFMFHWNSNEHRDVTEGPGQFWCTFCKFECEDNNQMRRHLLGAEHKEVIFAINRSVPISIKKKVIIDCPKCKRIFRYNIELRKHAAHCTLQPIGTASDDYQSKFCCKKCGVIFKSRTGLQKHGFLRHKEFQYFCSYCKIEFKTTNEAKKHRNSSEHRIKAAKLKRSDNLLKRCKICGKVYPDILALKDHLSKDHPREKSTCPYCGELFVLPQELGHHVRYKVCQPSTSKVCEEKQSESISKTSTTSTSPLVLTLSPSTMERIIGSETKPEPDQKTPSPTQTEDEVKPEKNTEKLPENVSENQYNCAKCRFSTNLEAELIFHNLLHTYPTIKRGEKISCPRCSKKFSKDSLRWHLRRHTGEKLFECELCSLKFGRKHNLLQHIQNVHSSGAGSSKISDEDKNNPSFQCDTCGKVFNKKYNLKQHINIHSKRDEQFRCAEESCIFVGRNASNLKAHMSVHLVEKMYQCEVTGCDYKGKTLTLLKRHAKKHIQTGEELLCPSCSFKTRIPGHLKRHMRIHTGEKPYKCPYCDYACSNSENLRKHVLTTAIHPGKSLYECKFCSTESTFKTNFHKEYRAHLILSHRIQENSSEYRVPS